MGPPVEPSRRPNPSCPAPGKALRRALASRFHPQLPTMSIEPAVEIPCYDQADGTVTNCRGGSLWLALSWMAGGCFRSPQ